MSIYYSNEARGKSNAMPSKGYNTSIGIDIDGEIIGKRGDGPQGENIYDYDILNGPNVGVSGSGLIIPKPPDLNILKEYTINPDGSKSLTKFYDEKQDSDISVMTNKINNGRMENISTIENKDKDISLLNKDINDIVINKDFSDLSLKGILEENSLNNIFFSEMNTKVIQDTLRYRVYKNTEQVISNQSTNDLFIIMRSIMLQYANFRTGLDNLTEEIKRLNEKVLDYAVENVTANVKQYKGYVKDLSELPTPLDRPGYENKGNYTYDISNLL